MENKMFLQHTFKIKRRRQSYAFNVFINHVSGTLKSNSALNIEHFLILFT